MAKYFVFLKDKNLKPENIKKGVKIFKTEGTYEGGGGPCDREEWPDLLQVLHDAGGVHAGVVFDTGFPVADGIVNNHFEGYFALGQSMEYMEENSCFLFGNSSAVDPEIGSSYFWGIWQAYGNINVAFGSRSDYAVFPLSEDGEEGTVAPYDLPVTWDRMENVDPEATGFETDYVYEVKIGNLVKYAPAHDENMEFFDGLNVCVFGRNVNGDPSVYGGKADSGTQSAWLYLESMDEDEISHELNLEPYNLNDSVMFYEAYTIDGETEYNGPIEPILDTHGTVSDIDFDVDTGADITVTPDDTKQHIATIASNTIMPYVTVNPVILVSESETITENGRIVIRASDYEADGISEITLDVSVGSGSDWLVDALAGNITDLSGYSLPAPTHARQYYYLFSNKGLSITKSPYITGTMPTVQNACYGMFSGTPITHLYCGGLIKADGQTSFGEFCSNCTNLEFIDFSSLTRVSSRYVFSSAFDNCPNLKTAIIHPEALKFEANLDNIVTKSATALENISFSAMAVNNIQLNWQPNLTATSVLNVLTHLDLTVSGKSVNFYSSGLTVTDDAQGSIQTAYNAAVAAGWTINNLTIVQP